MKRNIGKIDRTLRVLLSIVGIASFFIFKITGIWALLILGSSAFILLSAILSWCPMCAIMGKSTCEISPKG